MTRQSLNEIDQMVQDVLDGDKRAMARAISAVEKRAAHSDALLDKLYVHTGRAFRLGITGPPGAGKSTLVAALTAHYRREGRTVGIIAIDPTSPYSGGAVLGDRIRMLEVGMDEGVFIRSMAARGSLGGLSRAASDAADVLDAAGKDIVILETVGVGQSELDIAGAADATVVVLVPESGDAVQAMKAGLMEIADLFVINKSDRSGAEQAAAAIAMMLSFRVTHDAAQWIPPVVKTVASTPTGMEELASAIDAFRAHQNAHNTATQKRAMQMRKRVRELIESQRRVEFWDEARRAQLNAGLEPVLTRHATPYALARALLRAAITP